MLGLSVIIIAWLNGLTVRDERNGILCSLSRKDYELGRTPIFTDSFRTHLCFINNSVFIDSFIFEVIFVVRSDHVRKIVGSILALSNIHY